MWFRTLTLRSNEDQSSKPKDLPDLFHFNGCARFGQLVLDRFSFFLGHAFLDGLGGSFDQVFRFLQTERGDFANYLDDVDLVATDRLEDDVKLGLLLSRSRSLT